MTMRAAAQLRTSLDQHVFNMLLALVVTFLFMFIFGTSMPAWYVINEPVYNISTCSNAENYVDDIILRNWPNGKTDVKLATSLWFVSVRIQHGNDAEFDSSSFIPFFMVNHGTNQREHHLSALQPEMMLPRSIVTLLTLTFLAFGAASALIASNRPSRQIYYGLSGVMLISGTCTWISLAIPTSQEMILLSALDFCMTEGALTSSMFLQVLTVSCGILCFILSCICTHFAVLRMQIISAQRKLKQDCEIDPERNTKFGSISYGDEADDTNLIQL